MIVRLKQISWPRDFSQILEWTIYAALAALSLELIHHSLNFNRFKDLSSRYDSRRLWREDSGLSSQVQNIETRLRRDLEEFASTRDGTKWNEVIWQTWKDQSLEHWRSTWSKTNPNWNYTLLLDEVADEVIRTTFADVQDVIDLWTSFSKPVLKADLFRYLITYAYGGLYADVDTSCTKPIDFWLSEKQWRDPRVHSVIGLEYADEAHDSQNWWRWTDFVQYVMLSKPLSPIMRETIILAVTRTHRLAEQQQRDSIKDIDWDFISVIKTTGPTTFTDAALKVIQQETGFDEATIAKKTYGRMSAVTLGGTAVITSKDWQAGGKGVPEAYFVHHGQGSWI